MELKDSHSLMKKSLQILKMENKIRDIISKHQTFLCYMTTTEEVSQKTFVNQIIVQVQSIRYGTT
jgi:hypothetical protein